MHTYYEAKEMLKKELDAIVKKGELSAGSLDTVDKLLNSIKNSCKIIMYEEYSDEGYSYADSDIDMHEYSYARSGRTGARRDGAGRYSTARSGRRYSRRGYSYDGDGKEDKVDILREMMDEVSSDEERRTIQKLIRRMENG